MITDSFHNLHLFGEDVLYFSNTFSLSLFCTYATASCIPQKAAAVDQLEVESRGVMTLSSDLTLGCFSALSIILLRIILF